MDELFKKYPKLDDELIGLATEICFDKNSGKYGEVIKGNKTMHGRGIFLSKELGALYKGYFFDDNPDRKGELIYSDGGYYEGEFVNGKKHGKGKEIYPNGMEYNGEYINSEYHGYGVLIFLLMEIFMKASLIAEIGMDKEKCL